LPSGFVVRPIGALVFGRLGDLIGRKYTFLVSIVVMGLSTFTVGLLPSYDAIGVAAPVFLVGLRLLQGLALGGEYGGAAAYVAEHAPVNRLGAYTAWIQTTATLGLLLSLTVILGTRVAGRGRCFRGLGLARALPAVGGDAGPEHLDPLAHGRVAGLPAPAGQRAHVQRAGPRQLLPLVAT
jgi:MFS family permease